MNNFVDKYKFANPEDEYERGYNAGLRRAGLELDDGERSIKDLMEHIEVLGAHIAAAQTRAEITAAPVDLSSIIITDDMVTRAYWISLTDKSRTKRQIISEILEAALLQGPCPPDRDTKQPIVKKYHFASKLNSAGGVSALCFSRPRDIDLSRASWTNRKEAVTCEKCLTLMDAAPVDGERKL